MMEFEDPGEFEITPLEYLINLGIQGNHVLFDTARIRSAFTKSQDEICGMDEGILTQARDAVGEVLTIPDTEGKKEYIQGLPPNVQDVLVYLYFQMVEKTMLLNRTYHH